MYNKYSFLYLTTILIQDTKTLIVLLKITYVREELHTMALAGESFVEHKILRKPQPATVRRTSPRQSEG